LTYAVHINVQPYIVNSTALPTATEDEDYNVTMLDTTHAIWGFDPNYGDSLTYYLLYADTTQNMQAPNNLMDTTMFPGITYNDTLKAYIIHRDNMYAAVQGKVNTCKFWGVPNDTIKSTTPTWIKINPVSGLLYGVPGINDAPNNATVTALVRDPYGLIGFKQIPLNVMPVNHPPKILGAPADICEFLNSVDSLTFVVEDSDLIRAVPNNDSLVVTVSGQNTGITINGQVAPYTIIGVGPTGKIDTTIKVKLNLVSTLGGLDTLLITVTDKGNLVAQKQIHVHLSNAIAWRLNVGVANNNGAFQTLTLGKGFHATDGVDTTFCEFVLPPVPPVSVFDARWVINDPKLGSVGTYNDFRDSTLSKLSPIATWQGDVQAGGDVNQSYYPMYISWDTAAIPARPTKGVGSEGTLWIRDQFGGSSFNVNMATLAGANNLGPQVKLLRNLGGNADSVALEIFNSAVKGFFIVNDAFSAVKEVEGTVPTAVELGQNYPNPFTATTNIQFALPEQQSTKLEVIDVMGRVIATLVNGSVKSGNYNATWDGKDNAGNTVGSGVFFYRLTAGTHVEMKEMTVIR